MAWALDDAAASPDGAERIGSAGPRPGAKNPWALRTWRSLKTLSPCRRQQVLSESRCCDPLKVAPTKLKLTPRGSTRNLRSNTEDGYQQILTNVTPRADIAILRSNPSDGHQQILTNVTPRGDLVNLSSNPSDGYQQILTNVTPHTDIANLWPNPSDGYQQILTNVTPHGDLVNLSSHR